MPSAILVRGALVVGGLLFAFEAASYAEMAQNVADGQRWGDAVALCTVPVLAGVLAVGWALRRNRGRGAIAANLARSIWTADAAMLLVAVVLLGLSVP